MRLMRRLSIMLCLLWLTTNTALLAQSSVGGYGELHYNKPTSGLPLSQSAGTLDFHRFIIFLGYQFNNWIWFYSEYELEHTLVEGGEKTGEVALEQAYVNLQYRPYFGVRAGIMLVPVGIINPIHEPPTFNGVERPNVEKYIIPSTWREAGVGIAGKFKNGLVYEAYLMGGLDPKGLSGKNGIRGARQNAFESSAQDFAVTGRLDYQLNLNLKAGISFYYSSLERKADYGTALDGANLKMAEAHLLFSRGNFSARALAVYSNISEATALNQYFTQTLEENPGIGDAQFGAYGEVAYDLFGLMNPESEQRLFAFARYETYNTQHQTSGFSANPLFARKETTIGLTYLPAPQVALKLDYQFLNTDSSSDRQQFNLGMGYNF